MEREQEQKLDQVTKEETELERERKRKVVEDTQVKKLDQVHSLCVDSRPVNYIVHEIVSVPAFIP